MHCSIHWDKRSFHVQPHVVTTWLENHKPSKMSCSIFFTLLFYFLLVFSVNKYKSYIHTKKTTKATTPFHYTSLKVSLYISNLIITIKWQCDNDNLHLYTYSHYWCCAFHLTAYNGNTRKIMSIKQTRCPAVLMTVQLLSSASTVGGGDSPAFQWSHSNLGKCVAQIIN